MHYELAPIRYLSLQSSLLKDIDDWANGRGHISSGEDEESADNNRKETPEERRQRLSDEEDEVQW